MKIKKYPDVHDDKEYCCDIIKRDICDFLILGKCVLFGNKAIKYKKSTPLKLDECKMSYQEAIKMEELYKIEAVSQEELDALLGDGFVELGEDE